MIKNLLLIIFISVVVSYASDMFSQPSVSPETEQYRKYYESETDNWLSNEDFERLENRGREYIEKLNSPENLQKSVVDIFTKKLIIILIALPIWMIVGIKIIFSNDYNVYISIFLIIFVSLFFVNIIESILYAVSFFVGNRVFKKHTNTNKGEE